MSKLGDLYTNFSRIDLDTRGGYARVAHVKPSGRKNFPENCAFKLMRHDLESPQKGIDRFEGELRTLLEITQDKNCPSAITKVFDSGFTIVELSKSLQKPLSMIENTNHIEQINSDLDIISIGTDLKKFKDLRLELMNREPNRWLPYLTVELVPYEDSLLRQIRTLSSGNNSDLYRLPIREIISMGLQILDLVDYLHRRHNFAYIDWKPEHIYWNSLKPQLKVIDWNATDYFDDDRERKLLIREEIRMICGAALYCSLALNDPEDLKRPIGPKPKTVRNPSLPSQSRYWTDQPNFYDRDLILDDRIKLLIKKALDPTKGFDSPQELRGELLKYAEQVLGLPDIELSPQAISQQRKIEIQSWLDEADSAFANSEYRRSIQLSRRVLGIDPNNERAKAYLEKAESELSKADDTGSRLPREALQLYRSARSYIAGRDFQDAIRMLEDAIEIAFKKQVIFQEAQQLLESVKTSLEIEKIQQDIAIALNEEKWDSALKLYQAAINLDPSNEAIKNQSETLSDLLKAHSNLQRANFGGLFDNLGPLQSLVSSAREYFESTNALVKSTESLITRIKLIRLGSSVALTVLFITLFSFLGQGLGNLFAGTGTASMTATLTFSLKTHTPKPTTPAVPLIASSSITPSPTATATSTPTPELVTLGTGYITFGRVSAWDRPNGKFVGFLTLYQVVTILEKTNDHNDEWYRCSWGKNGDTQEGWILVRYIEIGSPPTLVP